MFGVVVILKKSQRAGCGHHAEMVSEFPEMLDCDCHGWVTEASSPVQSGVIGIAAAGDRAPAFVIASVY